MNGHVQLTPTNDENGIKEVILVHFHINSYSFSSCNYAYTSSAVAQSIPAHRNQYQSVHLQSWMLSILRITALETEEYNSSKSLQELHILTFCSSLIFPFSYLYSTKNPWPNNGFTWYDMYVRIYPALKS